MKIVFAYKFTLPLLLALSILLGGCTVLPPTLPSLSEVQTKQELDNYLDDLVKNGEPPAISVVVIKGNDIVYQRAYGKADGPRDIAASTDTVYQWWSLTKIFTVVAILQMVDAGELHLDDPVSQYLDFFDVDYPGENSSPINIQHLLSHSSGLGDIGLEILGWIHFDGDSPLRQTDLVKLKLPEHKQLDYEPGSEGRYSNLGYMVLAAIIEKVSGQSYADYISQHILEPLETRHTGFAYSEEMEKHEAVGSHPADFMSILAFLYIDKSRAIREKSAGRYWFNHIYSDQQGSTGLIGSTDDLAHLMIALMNGGVFDDTEILSPEKVELMATPLVTVTEGSPSKADDYKFGLGWFYLLKDDRVSLSHGGAGAAFVDMMRIYPDESLGIAVMANSTYLGRTIGAELVDAIANMDWDRL